MVSATSGVSCALACCCIAQNSFDLYDGGKIRAWEERELSKTHKDPLQDGDAVAASANASVAVPVHGVELPSEATPWARLKDHNVAQLNIPS
jgi:hypothetical protein